MSRANYMFDMQWALKYLDDFERFVYNEQLFLAKSTIQRVRETLETYGRTGFESNFEKIRMIEQALETGQSTKELVVSLRSEINKRLK